MILGESSYNLPLANLPRVTDPTNQTMGKYWATMFCRWGEFVSRKPQTVITLCLLLSALGGLGWINFRWGKNWGFLKFCLRGTDDSRLEHKANRLWIPEDSSFNLNKVNITSNNYGASRHWLMMLNHVSQHLYSYILQAWLDQHFPTKIRTQTVLIKTENVLTPQSVQLVKLLRRFSDERL